MSRLRRLVLSDRFFFIACRLLPHRGRLQEPEFECLARVVREREYYEKVEYIIAPGRCTNKKSVGNHPHRNERGFAGDVILDCGFEENLEVRGGRLLVGRQRDQCFVEFRQPFLARDVFDGGLRTLRINTVNEQNAVLFNLVRQHQNQRVVEGEVFGDGIKLRSIDWLFARARVVVLDHSRFKTKSLWSQEHPATPRLTATKKYRVTLLEFLEGYQPRLDQPRLLTGLRKQSEEI